MAAREGQTELEEWGDHLAIRSQSGERFLPYELIGKAVTTDAHVFILYHGGPTIVPLRAFEDAAGDASIRRSAGAPKQGMRPLTAEIRVDI